MKKTSRHESKNAVTKESSNQRKTGDKILGNQTKPSEINLTNGARDLDDKKKEMDTLV